MSTGLLTVHSSLNFGASLQAVSLYKALKEIDPDTALIDYRFPPFCPEIDKVRRNELRKPDKIIKTVIKCSFLIPQRKKFNSFLSMNVDKITEPIYSQEELSEVGKKFDNYVCGSDQIWNPEHIHYDDAFFLCFANERAQQFSYAASIGKKELSEKEREFIASKVQRLSAVSVREENAALLIKDLVDKKIHVNCDPVFLHNIDWWRSVESSGKPRSEQGYILVYRLTNNPVFDMALAKLKNELKLKVISITSNVHRKLNVDISILGAGPIDFLYLIDHAEFVLTDSFHGTAFSVLFQKKFFAIRNLSRSTRIENLLELLDMTDCLVEQDTDDVVLPSIDYAKKYLSNDITIKRMREQGMEYLRTNIDADRRLEQ